MKEQVFYWPYRSKKGYIRNVCLPKLKELDQMAYVYKGETIEIT